MKSRVYDLLSRIWCPKSKIPQKIRSSSNKTASVVPAFSISYHWVIFYAVSVVALVFVYMWYYSLVEWVPNNVATAISIGGAYLAMFVLIFAASKMVSISIPKESPWYVDQWVFQIVLAGICGIIATTIMLTVAGLSWGGPYMLVNIVINIPGFTLSLFLPPFVVVTIVRIIQRFKDQKSEFVSALKRWLSGSHTTTDE